MSDSICPHCGEPMSRDGRCSFCVPPKLYHPAQVVRRYFWLIGRSGAPALDPSQQSSRGGAVGPVSGWLAERGRLARILTEALGSEWREGTQTWKALVAFYGPSEGRKVDLLAELEDTSREEWGELAGEALGRIRGVLEAKGILKPREDEEENMDREEIIRGWEDIAEFLERSASEVRRWYSGEKPDPCGIREVVQKQGYRLVFAFRSDLEECWRELWRSEKPEQNRAAQGTTEQNRAE